MSEHSAAEIWIGGQVSVPIADKLCEVVCTADVSLEWGDRLFAPASLDELLSACKEREGVKLLWLCHDSARWGQFDELESFLIGREIAFDRISEAGSEYNAERVSFRPGYKPVRVPVHHSGEVIVSASVLDTVSDRLDLALRQFTRSKIEPGVTALRRLRRFVRQYTPTTLPALEPFEIMVRTVKIGRRLRNCNR